MTTTKVTDEVVDAVLAASRGLVAMLARSAESSGADVTVSQLRVLAILSTKGPEGLTALAKDLHASPPSASRLCGRLEQKGLIERQPVATSRREIRVVLTEAGAELYRTVVEARRREIQRAFAGLSKAECAQLVASIRRLAEMTGELEAP